MKRSVGDIDSPIILTGTGRCGSTLLHEVLSYHPDLAWLTPLTHVFPHQPWITRWEMHIVDMPGVGRSLRRWVRPSEAYPFWNSYCANFGPTRRDLTAADADDACMRVRDVLERSLTATRSRLLLKITGWPRVGLLRVLFPGAKFVHIRRDGRAVANSWVNVDWARLDHQAHWRWGDLDPDQQARYEAAGRSPIALAAIGWEVLMDAHAATLPSDALQLSYEDLCADPVAVVRRIADYAELRWPSGFGERIAAFEVRNANDVWRTKLSPADRASLETVIAPALERHGYGSGARSVE